MIVVRLDGRSLDQVRPLAMEIDPLPTPHGSALFTRGETQSLTTVTFGTALDVILTESAAKSVDSKFFFYTITFRRSALVSKDDEGTKPQGSRSWQPLPCAP